VYEKMACTGLGAALPSNLFSTDRSHLPLLAKKSTRKHDKPLIRKGS